MGASAREDQGGKRLSPNTRAVGNAGRTNGIRRNRPHFTWGDLDPDDIGKWIQQVTRHGVGLILGTTSDGGALSITLMDGDERLRDYPSSVDDFVELLAWCAERYG